MGTIESVVMLLDYLILFTHIIIAGSLGYFILVASRKQLKHDKYLLFLRKNALVIAFMAVVASIFGSLFFSEIAGLQPCQLCWYQRFFMYPLVFILGLGIWGKMKWTKAIVLVLSIPGAVIASYHYILQLAAFYGSSLPEVCAPGEVSCSMVTSFQFGYISIPLMALTAFLVIIGMALLHKK